MGSVLLRAVARAALSCLAGVLLWAFFGAVVFPLASGHVQLQRFPEYLAALPGIALYVGFFAAVTGLFLLLPAFAVYTIHEWIRMRRHASELRRSGMFASGALFALPAALAVAYSFAYRFSFFDVDWREFWRILPIATLTFWGAAVFPYWVAPALRRPLAAAAEPGVAADSQPQ